MSTKRRKIIKLNIEQEFCGMGGTQTWEPPIGWTIIQIFPFVDRYGTERLFVLLEEIEPEPINDKKKL